MSRTGGPQAEGRGPAVRSSGDREWVDAGMSSFGDLAAMVRTRAEGVRAKVDEGAVHDLRTATRRLRTPMTIFGDDAGAAGRKAIEKELRRVARRLGAVRDLDVLLVALTEASHAGAEQPLDPEDVAPLRRARKDARRSDADRLTAELDRDRFRRSVKGAAWLLGSGHPHPGSAATGGRSVQRVAYRAPGLIWAAAGGVFAYELDLLAADPTLIHEMRKAAKGLRYTLEAFEDSLEPGASLIASVTALQDASGEMHDAIVARDRARAFVDATHLGRAPRDAIRAFAERQDRRAEQDRSTIATRLAVVQGRRFRDALGRPVSSAAQRSHRACPNGGRRSVPMFATLGSGG